MTSVDQARSKSWLAFSDYPCMPTAAYRSMRGTACDRP